MKRRPSIGKVRTIVFDRDGDLCRICEAARATELAHLKARGMGGSRLRDTSENCVAACSDCHTGRRSLHSGHVKFTCLTDRGADGDMRFRVLPSLPKAEPWKDATC